MYNYACSLYFGCSLAWLIVSGSLDIRRFYDQLAARGTSTKDQWRLQRATCEHGDLAAKKWMQKIETIERCFPMSTRFFDPSWCDFLCVHNLLGLEYVGICCNMLGVPTTTETTIETFLNWNPVGTKSDPLIQPSQASYDMPRLVSDMAAMLLMFGSSLIRDHPSKHGFFKVGIQHSGI
jgi:hypothetical protein